MKKLFIIAAVLFVSFVSCEHKTNLSVGYSGDDISEQAGIIRNKETKAASLQLNIDGKWALYAGRSVNEIDLSKPIAEGDKSGTYALNVSDTARIYFQLVTQNGNAILSERQLPMAGGYNFRDLGGIKNTAGKYVKWGKVFRSDDLYKLTDADLQYLASIPLVSIVDFRAQSEIDAAPDKVPSSTKRDYVCSISPGRLNDTERVAKLSPTQMDSAMMDMNRLFVTDTASINQYRSYFELLQNEGDVPIMFHCSAGKDRTGMAAALFLFSLGVDESAILKDYMASNKYLADKYTALIAQYPNMESLFIVKPEFLKVGIDQMKKDHGSVDNYLTKVLNVDLEKMKKSYLY